MTTYLVTGGAGFIGANFIPYFLDAHPDCTLINLDLLTYAGNLDNLASVQNHPNYQFVKGDICEEDLVTKLFQKHKFQGVFHFAAESHVDNSIKDPDRFIKTNILGTHTLLKAAYALWMTTPHKPKEPFKTARFHHVSTDEVYGSLGAHGFFTETTPYNPSSPYSASKASSDHLVRSFDTTYGLNVTLSNCSNNFGPKQHDEKLIPTIIRNALAEKPIPIYGNGQNIRDWLYVLDHCKAIDLIFHKGSRGETYNVGTNNEKTNLDLARMICDSLDELKPRKNGRYRDLIAFVKDRPGHDVRYAIDATKIKTRLNWTPSSTPKNNLQLTITWFLKQSDILKTT